MTYEKRISKWDNVKGILIFLVVAGHGLNILWDRSSAARSLYFYIYLFHMPLFVFTTGLFSRKAIETGKHLKQRAVGYVLIGFFLKFALLLVDLFFGKFKSFSLASENTVPWYMFCMAAYMVLTWFLKEIPRPVLLVFFLIFSCFVGYDKSIGSFWLVSRFFVYYPWFLLGSAWNPERTEIPHGKTIVRIAAAVFLAIILTGVFHYNRFLVQYIGFVRGGQSYIAIGSKMGAEKVPWGALIRLAFYSVSFLMSLAVWILIPARRTAFAFAGERTLPVFFFHLPFIRAAVYAGLDTILEQNFPAGWKVLHILFCLGIGLLLLAPPFDRMFHWFWKQLERV